MFLFHVEHRFFIRKIGIIIVPDKWDVNVRIGDLIKIVNPDGTVVETRIKGISIRRNWDILIANNCFENEIVAGAQVWLQETSIKSPNHFP